MKSEKGIKVYCENCQNLNAPSVMNLNSARCIRKGGWFSPEHPCYYDPKEVNANNDCKDFIKKLVV